MTTPAPSSPRPSIQVAVRMRRERVQGAMSRWQTWRWVLDAVEPDQPGAGTQPRCLLQNDDEEHWLHPGLVVELFRDDAEGYALNASTPAPCFFVMWRLKDVAGSSDGEPVAVPELVSLSYHDAGRLLDAQETVEQVPAPPDVVAWMRDFANAHYVPEPKRRQRPESFRRLEDRFGNPASVSTGARKGGGHGG